MPDVVNVPKERCGTSSQVKAAGVVLIASQRGAIASLYDAQTSCTICSLGGLLLGQALGSVGGFFRIAQTICLRAAALSKFVEFLFRELLNADVAVLRRTRADDLVELSLDRRTIPVLRVLDQEDHQEGDDGRASVDDQLPGVGIVEQRPSQRPNDDHGDTDCKGDGLPAPRATLEANPVNALANDMMMP